MKVKFTNFWPSFEPKENFFYSALTQNGSNVEIVTGKSFADLEIVSVFEKRSRVISNKISRLITTGSKPNSDVALANTTNTLPKRNSDKRIWYTGENIRVPFGQDFDHSLSYEQDSYDGSNSYFPLWYSDLNFFSNSKFSNRAGVSIVKDELLSPRILKRTSRKLACAFVGNSHPMRARLLEELGKIGAVDVFGKAVGKPVKYKVDIASEYQFMVCLENDLYPGYVTEKFLEAYVSGCVPIYWGDFGNDNSVNRSSIINIADFETIDAAIGQISQFMQTPKFNEIFEQPLLRQLPNVQNVLAQFGQK
jgi:hypothetical protein